jgi:hypothetical protein
MATEMKFGNFVISRDGGTSDPQNETCACASHSWGQDVEGKVRETAEGTAGQRTVEEAEGHGMEVAKVTKLTGKVKVTE